MLFRSYGSGKKLKPIFVDKYDVDSTGMPNSTAGSTSGGGNPPFYQLNHLAGQNYLFTDGHVSWYGKEQLTLFYTDGTNGATIWLTKDTLNFRGSASGVNLTFQYIKSDGTTVVNTGLNPTKPKSIF